MVIADGLNYIKGYRYQLWCEAKAAGTRCCVVHVAAQEDECKQWNEERLRACGREAEIDKQRPTAGEHGASQGRDILGQLVPESHTAVYGDRVVEQESRSRSSSVDAFQDGDRPRPEDTMTPKSLYISDTKNSSKTSLSVNGHEPPSELPQVLHTTSIPTPSAAQPYSPSTLASLVMRYEPPSPFSRWDTPLFTIPTSDAHPPYTDIWSAIFPPPSKPTSKKALSQLPSQQTTSFPRETQASKLEEVRQHAATQLPRATSSSALQVLESTTLETVKLVLAAAREQNAADGDGGSVSLSIPLQHDQEDVFETEITIPMGTVLSQPLLQRLRRKYTQMQRAAISHGWEYAGMRDGRAGVVRGFIGFLGAELDGD